MAGSGYSYNMFHLKTWYGRRYHGHPAYRYPTPPLSSREKNKKKLPRSDTRKEKAHPLKRVPYKKHKKFHRNPFQSMERRNDTVPVALFLPTKPRSGRVHYILFIPVHTILASKKYPKSRKSIFTIVSYTKVDPGTGTTKCLVPGVFRVVWVVAFFITMFSHTTHAHTPASEFGDSLDPCVCRN